MKTFRKLYQDEGGQAFALIALLLVVLLGFAALVVDVGMMANSRSNLQKTADAAALAAAMDLPNLTKVNNTANYYVNLNAGSGITTVVVPDVPNKRVKVTVSESVEHFFAKVLGINSDTITATAVAEKREKWAGESLPFVNLDDKYVKGGEIQTWEFLKDKDAPGNYESLEKKEYDKAQTNDEGKIYFSIDFLNGIDATNGVQATIKTDISSIQSYGQPVYIFSLRADLMNSNLKEYLKAKNYHLDLSDLVLLQVTITAYDFNGIPLEDKSDKVRLKLQVNEVYTLIGDDVPTDYLLNPKVTSRLVE